MTSQELSELYLRLGERSLITVCKEGLKEVVPNDLLGVV